MDTQQTNVKKEKRVEDENLLNVIESDLDKAVNLLKEDHPFSQDGLDRALISACHHGLKYLVQTLVHLGANVQFKDTHGNTPLLICADNGFVDIVRFLVKWKADVNVFNSAGDSALMLAIRASGSSELVKVLLSEEGIDVNHQNLHGYTALAKAIEVRDVDVIKQLLDSCSEGEVAGDLSAASVPLLPGHVQTVGSMAQTAEEIAYKCGLGNIYQILKKNTRSGVSPLLAAFEKSDTKSLNMFLDCPFVEKGDVCKAFRKIFKRCQKENVKKFSKNEMLMIRRMLECGADVDTNLYNGSCPMSVVVEMGDYSLVELLCQHLHQRHQHGYKRETEALNAAAKSGRRDLIELLLKYKADINDDVHDYSDSPLDCALSHGHLECAKLLVQHGAEMDIESALRSARTKRLPEYMNFLFDNYLPEIVSCAAKEGSQLNKLLLEAANSGNLETIKYLLDAGADVNHENSYEETPLGMAKDGHVARLLISRGANVNNGITIGHSPLLTMLGSRYGHDSSTVEAVKVLLGNGAFVNHRSWKRSTPLIMAASRRGTVTMLQILLDHGADVNAQDEDGETALIVATRHGHSQYVSFLLQCGKEKNLCLNVQQRNGFTALTYAVVLKQTKILKELIDYNADVNIKDVRGESPVLLAVNSSANDALMMLIRAGSDVNCQNNEGFSPLMKAATICSKHSILILLNSAADVNAVSKKDSTLTALTLLSTYWHTKRNFKSCILALLSKGANSSYADPGFLFKMIILGQHDIITGLIHRGLGPDENEPSDLRLDFKSTTNISALSPLCMALLVGNASLARYFVGNMFLTNSDVTSLMGNTNLRVVLERKQYQDCADFLAELSSQPRSLVQLAFVSVLSAVGPSPGRENRVNMLPLPQFMKSKILFKSKDFQLKIPTEEIEYFPVEKIDHFIY